MRKILAKTFLLVFTSIVASCASSNTIDPIILDNTIQNENKVQQLANTTNSMNSSILHFDVKHPEVQNYINTKGYEKPGYKISVYKADLVFTTDNWSHTLTSQKQYLIDYSEGFILRDIPVGTQIEYAIHAYLCMSYDNFRSCEKTDDLWVNNGNKNYKLKTSDK